MEGFSSYLTLPFFSRIQGKAMRIELINAVIGLTFIAVWAMAGQFMANEP